MPDTLGYRKRIGIIVPSTNTTVGPECELFRVPGVTCHTGRVTIKERPLNTEEAFFEHMTMMREGMRSAIDQIMTGGLDADSCDCGQGFQLIADSHSNPSRTAFR